MQKSAYSTNVNVTASITLPKIFVAIASYRDPECQHTLRDLFAKAKHPERIFVGICWQFDPILDADCFEYPSQYPEQVRIIQYHASQSKGGCWARAEALSLKQNEDFVLMIDAHMRFVPNWDDEMLRALSMCPSSKAAITAPPPNYDPPDKLQPCENSISVMYVGALWQHDGFQPISLSGWIYKKEHWQKTPAYTPILVGNFLFGTARMFDEVPFDPHIFFRGQEPVYSARLWTHGWDLYQPNTTLIYHYWESPSRDKGGAHYKANNDVQASNRPKLALKRVRHLLGVEETQDSEALVEIEKYGMGKVRTLKEYWEFTDIDLNNNTIGEKAKNGRWTAFLPKKKVV
ncbi:MAG: GlcNAc-transferase family protein [Alphaproteobacteria bacterium]